MVVCLTEPLDSSMPRKLDDIEILQAALAGLQHQASEIQNKMAEICARIGGSQRSLPAENSPPPKTRVLSAAGRRRIAAAQRKRWAAYRKAVRGSITVDGLVSTEPGAGSRRLSPEAKERISEANKKRWAAFRLAKAAEASQSAPTSPGTFS
jgi:hypothetical protein